MSNMEKCAPKKPLANQSKTTVNQSESGEGVLCKDDRLVEELRTQIPDVNNIFNIHRRIGEGTFSNVFLASLKCHETVLESRRKLFAVKHLIPTSHPNRVERELKCLLEIGGVDNVVGVELCLRRNGAVAFVMPYAPHDKFIDYFDRMNARELQSYMKNLVLALKRVHSFGIIHRDVKPSNFLHDRKNNKYLLVDFGLAQINQLPAAVDSTNKTAEDADVSSGSTRKRKASDIDETENRSNMARKRARIQDPQSQNHASHNENESLLLQQQRPPQSNIPSPFKSPLKQSNEISTPKNTKSHYLDSALTRHIKSAVLGYSMNAKMISQRRQSSAAAQQPSQSTPNTNKYNPTNQRNGNGQTSSGGIATTAAACYCYGKPTVCNICIVKKEIHASRAGTPGYRPPEVLLKYAHQSTAVDMWAIGVIMISIVSHCYPFFKGSDDFSALAEMITVFGDEAIRKTALQMSRQICISRRKLPLHLRKLCIRLRNNRKTSRNFKTADNTQTPSGGANKDEIGQTAIATTCDNCQQIFVECLCANSDMNMDFSNDIYPDSAYDLMAKLLAINPKNRITAIEALDHPFLKQHL